MGNMKQRILNHLQLSPHKTAVEIRDALNIACNPHTYLDEMIRMGLIFSNKINGINRYALFCDALLAKSKILEIVLKNR